MSERVSESGAILLLRLSPQNVFDCIRQNVEAGASSGTETEVPARVLALSSSKQTEPGRRSGGHLASCLLTHSTAVDGRARLTGEGALLICPRITRVPGAFKGSFVKPLDVQPIYSP